jgi:energy-coupling factor transporter ATP-binding protein EcfA2
MHLQRVQVPNFRALKNIDITFEKERIPRIFPLASLNGGGKSTLLQLIFTLLTCSADPEKHEFLVNILKDFEIDNELFNPLAKIELLDGDNIITLDFYCESTYSLVDGILQNDESTIFKEFGFIEYLQEIQYLEKELQALYTEETSNTFRMEEIEIAIGLRKERISHFKIAQQNKEEIVTTLLSIDIYRICSYRLDNYDEVNIMCRIGDVNTNIDILQKISQKVFLAAPASQVFLFFSRQDINCLFGGKANGESYENVTQKNQDRLPEFFLHDFSTIKILAEAFEKAKHSDWQQAIKTRGQYGNKYARISKDLEYVFSGKIIEPLEDLSGIIIKTIENGKEKILHPEDLSHGELRRLTFYAWLRTKEIQDSIVLVDEIEIGLHPDWQYQIVKDLEEWAPSNQYILATHSYEICSALTPAHVKEIEPKLVKP